MDDGRGGLISTGDEGRIILAFLEQELLHGAVLGQTNRAVVGACGLTRVP
jgi:hypothetical protein